MNGALSIFNRIQDIVRTNSSNLHRFQNLNGTKNLKAPLLITNPQDRKLIERVYRNMDTVVQLCLRSGLNLKKSPPCITDIFSEMYTLLDLIFNNPDILQNCLFIQLFMNNLNMKCKQTIKIFKESKGKIEETSKWRRSLTMKSLIFSHMLSELQAQFPKDGNFIGEKFRITKKEAADFWINSFQDRTIVPWEEFRNEFSKVHPVRLGLEMHALKNTIDLTCNDHVSNFEFDVFTRLFQPWATLLNNWQVLAVTHPAFVAFLTYEEVKIKLQQFINKPGSYVFRFSCTKLGQWAIGYVAADHKIYQTIPHNKSLIQSLVEGSREGFYIYPNGRSKNVDLSHVLQANPLKDRIKVTLEQYQIYYEMGTTFEICKICDERNKNVKLEPCGHLLCKPCLRSWEESADGSGNCPFCRSEIKGSETLMIDAYEPSTSKFSSNLVNNKKINEEMSDTNFFDNKQLSLNENLSELSSAIKPSCVIPPPIPPKQTNIPPFAVVQSPKSFSSNITNNNITCENSLKNIQTNGKKLEEDFNSSLLTNLFNEGEGSIDPFAVISNPFVISGTSSTQHISNNELVSIQQESLPHFTDFVEMNLT